MEGISNPDLHSEHGSDDECFHTAPTSQSLPPPQPSKILMIHGDAMSGVSFSYRTRFLVPLLSRACSSGYTLFYPTAPNIKRPPDSTILNIRYNPSVIIPDRDFDAWAWGFGDYTKDLTQGWENSVREMIAYMKLHGPFEGIIGFSAGASMALCLISLAERQLPVSSLKDSLGVKKEDFQQPFKWAILFSGFKMYHEYYTPLYEPRIKTPCLHFIGKVDTYIPHQHTVDFTEICENKEVVWHDGAHGLCKGREAKEKILNWIKRWNGKYNPEHEWEDVVESDWQDLI